MKKSIITILGLVLLSIPAFAQTYSTIGQFQTTQLYYNPAAAGVSTSLRANIVYRKQWNNFVGAPQTFLGTVDGPLGRNLGGGIVIYNHTVGKINDLSINLNASYRIKTGSDSYFQFGLKGGVSFIDNGINSLIAEAWDPTDPYLLGAVKRGTLIRLGPGGYFKRKNFFAGLSSPDLLTLDPAKLYYDETTKKTTLKRNIIFITGTKKNLSEFIAFQPNLMLKCYGFKAITAYTNLGFEFNQTFTAGLGLSMPFGVEGVKIPLGYGLYTRVAVSPKLRLGFRYELSNNPVNNKAFKFKGEDNFGTTEIMLSYGFNN